MRSSALFKVTKEAAETIAAVQNALSDDGRIDWQEGIGIAMEGGGLIVAIAKNINELKAEIKDGVNISELEDVQAAFTEFYVLKSPISEELYEAAFVDLTTAISSIIALFKRT
jgi:predicted methyltransferase